MSCFATDVSLVQGKAPDPTRHVNYVKGMVLGVDDFTQEFAYLSGRDQWLARDLLGYGTARGLAVKVDEDKAATPDQLKKWKVTVSGGAALDPCGRLICVPRAQCGYLNEWLKGHGEEVTKKLGATVSSGSMDLHLVLSYRDCPTDSAPVPGEPCRSEDQLKAPSRIADDFLLELSLDAPRQTEEDALGEFLRWLRAIPMAASGTSTPLNTFREKVSAWAPKASAPTGLAVTAADAKAYLREALRIWVTELRPLAYGRACGCAAPQTAADHDERLLLATLKVDVELPVGQSWRVKALNGSDESLRPWLLHLRALQEGLFQFSPPPSPSPAPSPASGYRVVAAGRVRGAAAPGDPPVFGELKALGVKKGLVKFGFGQYAQPDDKTQYVVKAMAVHSAKLPVAAVRFFAFEPDGFVLRVTRGATEVDVPTLKTIEFLIEVGMFTVPA